MFESIKALTVVKAGVEKLYAFYYKPGGVEKKHNGWAMYDPVKEYQRMGVGTDRCKGWRISKINKDYVVGLLVSPRYTELKLIRQYSSHQHIPHFW